MGLFSSKKEGGLMDVIRCGEENYLVWKWRPSGEANSTKKENAPAQDRIVLLFYLY